MSRIFLYISLSVCLFLLNACADQDIDPSDSFVVVLSQDNSFGYTSQNFEKGESIRINAIGSIPEGLTGFSFEKNIGNTGFSPIPTEEITLISGSLPIPNGNTSLFSFTADIKINENAGQIVTLRITANSLGQNQRAIYSYQVVAQGQGGSGGVYPLLYPVFEVILGGQGTDIGSYLASSVGSSQGIYTDAQISMLSTSQQRNINISAGITDAEGNATTGTEATIAALISPNDRANRGFEDAGLGTNASMTSFKYEPNISTQASFDAITATSLSLNIVHNTEMRFQSLSVGATYSFVSQNGKKGYLRILSITGAEESQNITFKVLTQR